MAGAAGGAVVGGGTGAVAGAAVGSAGIVTGPGVIATEGAAITAGAATGAVVGGGYGAWQGSQTGVEAGTQAGSDVGRWLDDHILSVENGEEEAAKEGEQKTQCAGDCAQETRSEKKPPFKGEPGSTVQGPDNSRTYGEDGYPLTDRDAGHSDESGIGA
ncbi:hypothetical protein ABRA89_20315, partial [Fulvimarina sp. MAC8]